MITRKQYMRKEATHREYYGQFVTDSVKQYVSSAIGKDRIAKSTDPHLSDIPLHNWDMLHAIKDMCIHKVSEAAEHADGTLYWSLSDQVCIAKEAARQIKEA